jgi:transcriptional regulator with XRE-family HTH domain
MTICDDSSLSVNSLIALPLGTHARCATRGIAICEVGRKPRQTQNLVTDRVIENINRALDARGWTQTALAQAVPVTPSTVSMWLSRQRDFTPAMLTKIAAALSVDPSVLVCQPAEASSAHQNEEKVLREPSGRAQTANYLSNERATSDEGLHGQFGRDTIDQFDARLRRLDDVANRQEQTASSLDAALDHLRAILDEYNDLAAAFVHAPPDQQSATARTLQPSEHRVPRKSHKSPRGKARR